MHELVNYEAEVSVLGKVLVEGMLFKELIVEEKHFYEKRHQVIFRAMRQVDDAGDRIDIVTVTTALGEAIHQVGGTMYLSKMAESVASLAALKHHEQLVLNAYRIRRARTEVMAFAENPSENGLIQLIPELEILRDEGEVEQEKTTNDYLLDISADVYFPSDEPSGFETSFKPFDEITGGLQKGELIIIAARPSVGKTAFALNLAAGHAKNGGRCLFFSLEMGTKSLLQRLISSEGRIDSQKWRSNMFADDDFARVGDAVGLISTWSIDIFDQLQTVNQITTAVRRAVYQQPEEKHVVVIDYLQLMAPSVRGERRDLEVGEMTRALKQLAMELEIPVVLLSQLSRGVEARSNKRPLLSDLRESGNIEQDADVVAFLYREDYYDHQKEGEHPMEVIIAKQRNGPTGTVNFVFQKEYGRFVAVERAWVAGG